LVGLSLAYEEWQAVIVSLPHDERAVPRSLPNFRRG
jgi:hypothetical protein